MIKKHNTPSGGAVFDARFGELRVLLSGVSGDEAVRRPLAIASVLVGTAAFEAACTAPSEWVSRPITLAVELDGLSAQPDGRTNSTH